MCQLPTAYSTLQTRITVVVAINERMATHQDDRDALPPAITLNPQIPQLQNVLAKLFDDPSNSDVEFVFPSGSHLAPTRLYALKWVLSMRSEYFKSS